MCRLVYLRGKGWTDSGTLLFSGNEFNLLGPLPIVTALTLSAAVLGKTLPLALSA